ncbi:MAG: LamG-like jellyroll fold domain-containing protein, partial [Flavobacteriales bacterium]
GYWPFCGNANDESGNGNDGTVNGATLTEDRFGNANAAYGFDGVDDYINCGNNDALNLNNFSISVWHKLNDLPQSAIDENVLVVKSDYNPGTLGYRIAASSEPQVAEYLIWSRLGGGGQCGGYVNTNQPPISQVWSNIVAIKNQDTISIYRNGELENTLTGVCGDFNNQRPLLFGCKYDYNEILNGFYDGSLDDIGIWNRALTPEEVQELYTLDACTFTVYDTTYVTVYDTLTTYETAYDTLYTYETIYDTLTTYVTVTDTLLIDITFTGFEGQPSWLNTVTVFPNPASDHITIDYGNFALMAGYNTIITDAAGATVYSSAVNSQQAYIDINAWGAAGVYYMTIYDASGAAVAVRH